MRSSLLQVWRILPVWLQIVLSRVIRPLFQVFAAAVIFNEEHKILLVKMTYWRVHPWGMPGGSLEYSESAEEAVVREVHEETGLEIGVEKLLLVKTWSPDKVGLYYLCRIKAGTFQPSDEVSEYGYFSMTDLPDVRPFDVGLIGQIFQMTRLDEHELA
jgi:8-oxo-dGTP pyrophosphatase MutT (NUDIX family)